MSLDQANTPVPVLLDTDVFSYVYVSKSGDQHDRWTPVLAGRTITIPVQVAVELRAWPALRNWGQNRTERLETQITALQIIQVTGSVQSSYVDLTVWAKTNGHAIHAKQHTADRWIAATALAYNLEIAANDGIYDDVPNLMRLVPK